MSKKMNDSFLENCGGWTPAPDILARKYGFESAYLWGRLRRLCQLGNGQYTISPEALGKRFGMSRRTVIDRLKAMIQDGYIEDLTPGVRNRAHTYSAKKGEEKIISGMQNLHTEAEEVPEDDELGVQPLHSDDAEFAHQDDPGMQNLPNRYAKNAHPGMQNLHLNRESLETDKETPNGVVGKPTRPTKRERAPVEQPGPKTIVKDKFLELTGLDMPGLKSDRNFWWAQFGEILRIAKDNVQQAIKIMTKVIKYMQSEGLPISGPKSIVNLCRSVAAGQPLNGRYPEPEEPTEKPIAIEIATGKPVNSL